MSVVTAIVFLVLLLANLIDRLVVRGAEFYVWPRTCWRHLVTGWLVGNGCVSVAVLVGLVPTAAMNVLPWGLSVWCGYSMVMRHVRPDVPAEAQ